MPHRTIQPISTERWQEISDLFAEASSLSREEQGSFLAQRCGTDSELRREVESLLAHGRPEDSLFGDAPPRATVPGGSPDFADWVGRRLGKYELKEVISTGGMGVVFLAEQDHPRRDVAIKLLLRGLFLTGARRRFEAEAEILGRLRHPCIAEVFEAGRAAITPPLEHGPTAPMHYFAMEYVEGGRRLLDYAKERELSLRERLSLFARVCDGVQHGHQKGVIHRDLKPSNILVTDDQKATGEKTPLPKIIDFGVAKCTDADMAVTTMQTAAGELIGTLQYMAPEQCDADVLAIDTRADVYALGVILYQLTTGRVPYDVSNLTIQAAVRVISDQDPVPASQFNRKLRGDVETIIAKAMSKDRERRYESAAALSDDVQRFLKGDPISARKPTRWMRSMRWITRHPRWTAVLGGLAISGLIVGATSLIIWLANRVPHRVELTSFGSRYDTESGFQAQHGDRAALFALSGDEICAWTAGESGIRLASMVERPEKSGGGKVVVIGFGDSADNLDYRNKICVFDANEPEEPVTKIALESSALEEMPDDGWPRPAGDKDRDYRLEGFILQRAWMLDVFDNDEHPGPEIITFHMFQPGSQGVLHIYNLEGDMLFRAWQDGGINDVYSMSGPGLLVCSAIRGDQDGSRFSPELKGSHPTVLFAFKPEAGLISNGWILPKAPDPKLNPRYDGDRWNGEQFKPQWYKTTCPAKWAPVSTVQLRLRPPVVRSWDATTSAQLLFWFPKLRGTDNAPYEISLWIDADGEVIRRPLDSNQVRDAQAKDPSLPRNDQIEIVDWEETLFPCPTMGRGTTN